jgi:hypothetical protein
MNSVYEHSASIKAGKLSSVQTTRDLSSSAQLAWSFIYIYIYI